jgi:hypothetical protein
VLLQRGHAFGNGGRFGDETEALVRSNARRKVAADPGLVLDEENAQRGMDSTPARC